MKAFLKNIFSKFGIDIRKKRKWMDLSHLLLIYEIKTVIDIGANTGQFALDICKIDKNITIYSFEPIPSVYDVLVKNLAHISNFKAFNLGLGEEKGVLDINLNDASPSSSFLDMSDIHLDNFSHAQKTQKTHVKVERLDDVIDCNTLNNNILTKIDVQGYEDQVLNGGKNVITKSKIIIIEVSFKELYKGQKLFGDIFNKMIALNFEFVGLIGEAYDSKNEDLLFGDAIFRKQ